jgi:cysteine synthase A
MATNIEDKSPKKISSEKIYDSIIDTIGNTPIVKLCRLPKTAGCKAEILCKLEFFNPLASVKDRIGRAMIEAAEKNGNLTPGKTILIEPTSGNTGIALAFVAAAKGYKLILTMPESMSEERKKLLILLGAELKLTPAKKGMKGAIEKAEQLLKELPDSVMLQQFQNPANPNVHTLTTAEEIWEHTNGKLDMLIAGVGTGGTITGCAQVLKPRLKNLKIVAVEPEDSPVLSGGPPGPHKIQGIGAGFLPQILMTELIDEVISIGNETAFETARNTAKLEGIPVGISSGAAIAAAIEIGNRKGMESKRILVIVPSFAERYLSTDLFSGL